MSELILNKFIIGENLMFYKPKVIDWAYESVKRQFSSVNWQF